MPLTVYTAMRNYRAAYRVTLTFAEWKKQFRAIGKREGYTAAQIKEYGRHIAYAIKVGK